MYIGDLARISLHWRVLAYTGDDCASDDVTSLHTPELPVPDDVTSLQRPLLADVVTAPLVTVSSNFHFFYYAVSGSLKTAPLYRKDGTE